MSLKNLLLYALFVVLVGLWLVQQWRQQGSVEVSSTAQTQFVDKRPQTKVQPKISQTSNDDSKQCPFPLVLNSDQAFILNITADSELAPLQLELEQAITELLSLYHTWLGSALQSGLSFDLVLLPEHEFNALLMSKGVAPQQYLGVYLAAEDIAVVKYLSAEQALSTSIHELVHAINFKVFGVLPRFLNEGLAQYAQHSIEQNIHFDGFHLPAQLSQAEAKAELLDFYSLLHSEQDWHTSNNVSLYLTGNAWAHFLLSTEQGLSAVIELLQQKQQSPCQALSSDRIIAVLTTHYPNFEQDFNYWFEQL